MWPIGAIPNNIRIINAGFWPMGAIPRDTGIIDAGLWPMGVRIAATILWPMAMGTRIASIVV